MSTLRLCRRCICNLAYRSLNFSLLRHHFESSLISKIRGLDTPRSRFRKAPPVTRPVTKILYITAQKAPPLKRRATAKRNRLSEPCSPGLQTRWFSTPFENPIPENENFITRNLQIGSHLGSATAFSESHHDR